VSRRISSRAAWCSHSLPSIMSWTQYVVQGLTPWVIHKRGNCHRNIDRSNIIPLLDDSYELGPELDRQLVKPLTSAVTLPRNNLRLQIYLGLY
jgi:hypothetical protein